MNDVLRRNLTLAAVLLLIWAGWYGWQDWKLKQELNRLADIARSSELDKLLTDPPEDIRSNVDLAVRGIVLRQGKDGRKSFELKADWATLDEKPSDITMRDPDILYTLESKDRNGADRLVHAVSRIGRVENGNTRITMSGNVHADSDTNTLASDEAVYLSERRLLDFPSGADLAGDGLEGTAKHLFWNLNDNTITGDHGVKARWYPSEGDLPQSKPEPAPMLSDGSEPDVSDSAVLLEEQP